MAKRLSQKQKEDISRKFIEGYSIDLLTEEFNSTKLTIERYLKKTLGEYEYKSIKSKNVINHKNKKKTDSVISDQSIKEKGSHEDDSDVKIVDSKNMEFSPFTEIVPLHEEIQDLTRKDLSSVPISEISFPKVVYMVVDKKIELEIKTLRDYPEWNFLSDNELQRKTIEIFSDLKTAKSFCSPDQKVIKVTNTKVFEIAAHILNSKGITRIVSDKTLIAL